jgi:hypothetical protein
MEALTYSKGDTRFWITAARNTLSGQQPTLQSALNVPSRVAGGSGTGATLVPVLQTSCDSSTAFLIKKECKGQIDWSKETFVRRSLGLVVAQLFLLNGCVAFAQNASTGALAGLVTDPSGAVITGATISVTNSATGESRTVKSGSAGNYSAALLQPGTYVVSVSKEGFRDAKYSHVVVNVTETEALNVALSMGDASQTIEVSASSLQLQTQTSSLGSVTSEKMVQSLPLVTRNYSQIIALSPGVNSDVTNAGNLGRGASQQSVSSAGSSEMDNNFQMNGVGVNDVQESGNFSGGVPIPNPDTIQEFKVQTAAYDAAFGRNAGANVNVIIKGGSDRFHGSAFEFFRNTALNANDYFLKQLHQQRPVMQQHQFGFTLGGPVVHNKITFFTSYQGTRQANGYASTCYTSFNEPALTNDNRTAAGLGALFGGTSGYSGTGGGANVIQGNGSNISPQALAFLNLKLPNGQWLVPNAQSVNSGSTNPATAGQVALSQACPFNEDQYMANADWHQSDRSTWEERFFFVNSHETLSLNTPNFGGAAVPGFATSVPNHFRNFTLTNNFVLTPQILNQAIIGYNRVFVGTHQATPFSWSSIGVNAPSGPQVSDNNLPELAILGNFTAGGNGQEVNDVQNQYSIQDNLSWVKGRHSLRIGGGIERDDVAYDHYLFLGGLEFQTFQDFLLGLPGGSAANGGNGTLYSNIYQTEDVPGNLDRNLRIYNSNFYVQDDFQVTHRLTLNVGFRYERLGDMAEENGRNANTDFSALDPNPPAGGTIQGYVVAGNFPGVAPPGVIVQHGSKLAFDGVGQNTLNPRVGFSWQVPGTDRIVLRGGYGVYHQAISGQPTVQLVFGQPWAEIRQQIQPTTASFQTPFQPVPNFPTFVPYSPTTTLSGYSFARNLRPPMVQHYSLNVQTMIAKDTILEVGYIGSRGDHLLTIQLPNQAQYAGPQTAIRGATINTVTNIQQRLPVQGFGPSTFHQIDSRAQSWYNALEASLSRRFSNGLQFLASYTWAKDMATTSGSISGGNGGTQLGNQLDIAHDYGPDNFIRPQRFVFSGSYLLPSLTGGNSLFRQAVNGWTLSGVVTIQDGDLLTITGLNSHNVLGITNDFAQLSGACTPGQYVNRGSTQSKLSNYVNKGCFTGAYPIVGSDGIATGFGNSRPGILQGPGQRNVDAALAKKFALKWPSEAGSLEFRAEAFNALNTAQFSNPGIAQNAANFGEIQTLAVAPRIFQFALKASF